MAEATQLDAEQDALRTKMEESREALAHKIEMLEEKVTETVQNATATVAEATATVMETVQTATASVTDTVDNVTNAVQGTVDTVRQSVEGTVDSVKNAFDLSRQVNEHPWLSVAGAVAVGYVGGLMLNGGYRRQRPSPVVAPTRPSFSAADLSQPVAGFTEPASFSEAPASRPANPSVPSQPGWMSQLAGTFGPEIGKLQSLALGVALSSVRNIVVDAVPPGMRQPVSEIIDGFTQKLGGQAVHGSMQQEKCAE